MKVLITGGNGGLGQALTAPLTAAGHTYISVDVDSIDITDPRAVRTCFAEHTPDLVIHCAALTNVDLCAQQPDEAIRVNGYGTQNVAVACAKAGIPMCYISTNEVFDGERGIPYLEYDAPHPANPYGYSKYVGECVVREVLPAHFIVRTSWLFAHTGRNFLQRILALAREGKPLTVVTDEVASPTYVPDLAAAIVQLVETGQYGIFHLVNEGYTSRFNFAKAILEGYGMVGHPLSPITRAQFPRPSRPPAYGALRNMMAALVGVRLRTWQEALSAFIAHENL